MYAAEQRAEHHWAGAVRTSVVTSLKFEDYIRVRQIDLATFQPTESHAAACT